MARAPTDYGVSVPTDDQYRRLLEFRTTLRRFDQWSRDAAHAHGLTHAQHQLLLAIRGQAGEPGPTIGEVADQLLVKPHTTGELIDRVHALGLVERVRDECDRRRVRLRLTVQGDRLLQDLTDVHLDELRQLGPLLGGL